MEHTHALYTYIALETNLIEEELLLKRRDGNFKIIEILVMMNSLEERSRSEKFGESL